MNFDILNAELERSVSLIADNKSTLINERPKLRQILREAGYWPSPDLAGSIQDLSSHERISLMLSVNLHRTLNFRRWRAQINDESLYVTPAQELICAYPHQNKDTKAWVDRWNAARVILNSATRSTKARRTSKPGSINAYALAIDPIWKSISAFNAPYPPFDYNVDWAVICVLREEAITVKLLKDNEYIEIEQQGADLPPPLFVGFDTDLSLRNKELLNRFK